MGFEIEDQGLGIEDFGLKWNLGLSFGLCVNNGNQIENWKLRPRDCGLDLELEVEI